jgi:histidine triad (HIT) family protein
LNEATSEELEMTDCVFCRILADEIPSRRVYEDDTCIGFLDIAPFHRGHTVIIPRRHLSDGTTDASAWAEVSGAIVAVATMVKEKLGASGANILSNAGTDAGQTVFHFHVHVIPRYPDNPGMAGLSQCDTQAHDLDAVHAQLLS